MKKAISLLLVLLMALGMNTLAFAASDIPGTFGQRTLAMNDSQRLLAPPLATQGATQTYTAAANEIFLVSGGKPVAPETTLYPDETYKYDIYYTSTGATGTAADILAASAKLTKADLGTSGAVRLRTIKGSSAISSAKIKTVGTGTTQTYRLEIETRATYGTSTTDVEYQLYATETNSGKTFLDSNHTFEVGFKEISDSATEVGEEGTITITNENPVITKDQFAEIAKSANYKNVIFEAEDGNWTYKGKVAGMKSTNFAYNYDPDTDLINKFADQEFKFLTFPSGVTFPTTGEMRIDVSDVSDDFSTMNAYLYRDGKLTEINSTYDSASDELVFRTNYLGKFVITNQPITDTTLMPEPDADEEPIIVPEVPGAGENPATGADSASAAVALGLVSIASAALISRKRK